jgi:5-methylthioadenosine/S-adenosylhomocysteine deaminase
MGDRLGTLAPGYLADLVMLDFDGLHAVPNYALLDNIVYTCHGRDVHTVMVNGEIVVRDHVLQTRDERELVALAEESGPALIRRAVESDEELAWLWENG